MNYKESAIDLINRRIDEAIDRNKQGGSDRYPQWELSETEVSRLLKEVLSVLSHHKVSKYTASIVDGQFAIKKAI